MSQAPSSGITERAAWRRKSCEEVLSPEQVICDPHHHLWDHPGDVYFADELAADIGDGHKVTKTVYVECGHAYRDSGPAHLASVGETEFVVSQDKILSERLGHSVIRGIIGFADLTLANGVGEVLEAHSAAAEGRFVGIRHATACAPDDTIEGHGTNPPPGLMGETKFVAGVRVLGEMGLTYDAWLYHPQIAEIVSLARAAPQTTIILDHLGAPLGIGSFKGKRDDVLAHCREHLTALAQLPNAHLKLGGIGMPLYGNGWHRLNAPPDSKTIAGVWGDHIRWCIDTFGPDRVMFESNFPPDGRSCSYRTLWNAFKRIAEPYQFSEREQMFHDTATRVYRL